MHDCIDKHIEIAAPVPRVWRALTDARQFGQWFQVALEGPFVAGQPVGGRMTVPGYEHLRFDIEVKAIEPQTYFSYTWHPYAIDPKVDYAQETPTLVEFRLKATQRGTLVSLKESGFDRIPNARQTDAFRMNSDGWAQQMKSLEAYVYKTSE